MLFIGLAWFFRILSQGSFIVGTIICGYIWIDKKLFKHAAYLLLTTILYTYALKLAFKIPLNPLLNLSGYAFPSGHTQSTLVYYGHLTYHAQTSYLKWFLYGILMLGTGYYLIYFGFHNYIDILGGYFFGTILLVSYIQLIKQSAQIIFGMLALCNTTLIICIASSKEPYTYHVFSYVTLIGLLALDSWHLLFKTDKKV